MRTLAGITAALLLTPVLLTLYLRYIEEVMLWFKRYQPRDRVRASLIIAIGCTGRSYKQAEELADEILVHLRARWL